MNLTQATYRKKIAPVIGIAPNLDGNPPKIVLPPSYSDTLSSLGAIPVILPPLILSSYSIKPYIHFIHGLVLPGSRNDVNPKKYGELPDPHLGPVSPELENSHYRWLEAAHEHRIPVLAICFGCQILNVFRGGTLIQDILASSGNHLNHQPDVLPHVRVHAVTFDGKSKYFPELMEGTFQVNSGHHQAVAKPGDDLTIIAKASDGITEAYESTLPGHWVVGVQWHPERIWQEEEASRILFTRFIEAASRYAVEHGHSHSQ